MHIFHLWEITWGLSAGWFSIHNFWWMVQWYDSSRYKTNFRKSIWSKLVCYKINKTKNIFWGVEPKIIVLYTLYFIGLLIFLKNKFFAIYIQKYFIKNIFLLKVHTYSITNYAFFIICYFIFQFKLNILKCK